MGPDGHGDLKMRPPGLAAAAAVAAMARAAAELGATPGGVAEAAEAAAEALAAVERPANSAAGGQEGPWYRPLLLPVKTGTFSMARSGATYCGSSTGESMADECEVADVEADTENAADGEVSVSGSAGAETQAVEAGNLGVDECTLTAVQDGSEAACAGGYEQQQAKDGFEAVAASCHHRCHECSDAEAKEIEAKSQEQNGAAMEACTDTPLVEDALERCEVEFPPEVTMLLLPGECPADASARMQAAIEQLAKERRGAEARDLLQTLQSFHRWFAENG